MVPVIDLLDIEVVDERPDAIVIRVVTATDTRTVQEILVPLDAIDDGPVRKGQRGDLTVHRQWARKAGLV